MSLDPTSLEAELRKLRPATPGDPLLTRLEGCAEATWTEPDPMEFQFERQLHAISPAALPPALMASLEAAVRDVPFPADVKIVAFPKGRTATTAREPKHRWWSAAAAVAILGASAAFLVPARQNHATSAANNTSPTTPSISATATPLTPASFNRGLSEASDEGVIWPSENRPHRVLRVVYKDQVTLRDNSGRTYQVERPRVEYILVPAKTD